jgi:hypothetical protein
MAALSGMFPVILFLCGYERILLLDDESNFCIVLSVTNS